MARPNSYVLSVKYPPLSEDSARKEKLINYLILIKINNLKVLIPCKNDKFGYSSLNKIYC